MSSTELYDKIKKLEQVGVLRGLLFLREGTKMTREFEEVVSMPTWTRAGSQVMEELGLITVEEGQRLRLNHTLTEKGQRVSDILVKLLNEI